MTPFKMNMGSSRQYWEEFSNEAVKRVMDMPLNRRCNRHIKPAPRKALSGLNTSDLADFCPDCRFACGLPITLSPSLRSSAEAVHSVEHGYNPGHGTTLAELHRVATRPQPHRTYWG